MWLLSEPCCFRGFESAKETEPRVRRGKGVRNPDSIVVRSLRENEVARLHVRGQTSVLWRTYNEERKE